MDVSVEVNFTSINFWNPENKETNHYNVNIICLFSGDRMPILFSVVSRGSTVLAKYASCAGNFTEVSEQVLAKISPENAKLTYSHGR